MSNTPDQPDKADVAVDKLRTFLSLVSNSIGCRTFQNLYARIGGKTEAEDVMWDGERSCAYFASGLLAVMGLIDRAHATVASLEKIIVADPKWKQIDEPSPGALLFWELAPDSAGQLYRHCGFYIDDKHAISNSELSRVPIAHHTTFGILPDGSPKRRIEAIYQHELLSTSKL
jgi:hypothetical protein